MNLAILLSAGLAAGEAQAQSLAIRDELSEDQCREALVKEPEAPPECVSDFASLGHFETALNDLPAIQEVGLLRVLTVYSHTNYFLRDGTPDGLEYRLLQLMVKGMNKRRPKGSRALTLVFIPVPFDQLLPLLIAGHGDIAASFLTVAPEREALVSFSRPYWTGVSELLVTGKGSPKARDIADFSGKTVHIVSGTTFETSLAKANDHLKRMKLAPINIVPVGKGVDQENLLRLVGGGSITATMADSAIARFWAKALGNFQTQDAIPLSARLMAVADVYDALISRRVYKEGMPHEKAVSIIQEGRGSHFDPDLVDAFAVLHEEFRSIALRFADTDTDLADKKIQLDRLSG